MATETQLPQLTDYQPYAVAVERVSSVQAEIDAVRREMAEAQDRADCLAASIKSLEDVDAAEAAKSEAERVQLRLTLRQPALQRAQDEAATQRREAAHVVEREVRPLQEEALQRVVNTARALLEAHQEALELSRAVNRATDRPGVPNAAPPIAIAHLREFISRHASKEVRLP